MTSTTNEVSRNSSPRRDQFMMAGTDPNQHLSGFICDVCQASFRSRQALNGHMKKHGGKKVSEAEVNAAHNSNKKHWSYDEKATLASFEFLYRDVGKATSRNGLIYEAYCNSNLRERTRDAVIKQMKTAAYITIRDAYFETMLAKDDSSDSSASSSSSASVASTDGLSQSDMDEVEQLLNHIGREDPDEPLICYSWKEQSGDVPVVAPENDLPDIHSLEWNKYLFESIIRSYKSNTDDLPNKELVEGAEMVFSGANPELALGAIEECIASFSASIEKEKKRQHQHKFFANKQIHAREVYRKKGLRKPKNTSWRKVDQTLSKKARSAFDHKRTREMWKNNRGKLIKDILDGKKQGKDPEKIPNFADHWKSTYEKQATTHNIPDSTQMPEYHIWNIVGEDELKAQLGKMQNKTSAGPDGLTVPFMKENKHHILILLNCFILLGKVPTSLKQSRTVFIPKKDKASEPRDYRPISVSSVLLRLFNNILANRLLKVAPLDPRQRGFLPVDGVCENIMLAEGLIDMAHREKRSIFMANLDMSNAYGSVNHDALIKCLKENGGDEPLVNYVRDLYTDFTTDLMVGKTKHTTKVSRGVVQGDPLSCILFNIVMERVIKAIPDHLGFQISPSEPLAANGMAFADDMTVITSSSEGLQTALNSLVEAATPLGMSFNPSKCQYLALESIRGKKMYVNDKLNITMYGKKLAGTSEQDTWRYLGAWYNHKGLANSVINLHTWIDRLKKEKSLKPQEKLYVIRFHIIPRLIFRLCMEKVSAANMLKCDNIIRNALTGKHGILHLHGKTPLSFFYTNIKDGGLGLIRLRHTIPYLIHERFGRLTENPSPVIKAVAEKTCNELRIKKAERLFARHTDKEGKELVGSSKLETRNLTKTVLYEKVDGHGLRFASDVPYAHSWVLAGSTKHMKGNTYCAALALRSNTLMCKSRAGRGKPDYNKKCRHGCDADETIEHITQVCPRTYAERVKRHNKLCKVLKSTMLRCGFQKENIFGEPRVNLEDGGALVPDVVAFKGNTGYVLDPTICGDYGNPDLRFDAKVEKYDVPEVREYFQENHPTSEVKIGGVAISHRGIVSKKSADLLLELGLSKSDIARLSMCVIKGSIICYNRFQLKTGKAEWEHFLHRINNRNRGKE